MLNHIHDKPVNPKRVVVLGAKGFVGAATVKRLKADNIDVLGLGREDIDLTDCHAAETLIKHLRADDALVIISAKAPCKNHNMLLQNIQMMKQICDALVQQPVQQVIYISSDAVYTDSMSKLNEASLAAPTSLHGAMHLAREQMLQSVINKEALTILRPSLLYGLHDPHNGYGPNSFYRLALAEKTIELFGGGEEQRDHVYIDDVAELIYLCLSYRSHGVLNITTGTVTSFAEVAELVKQVTSKPVEVKCKVRHSPMPHNGYRAFDNTTCEQAFAHFQYTLLEAGLKKMHELSRGHQ